MRPVLLTIPVLLLSGLIGSPTATRAEDEKLPTIKDIMRESHFCRTAYIKTIREELAKSEPDWPLTEKKSRELITSGKQLAKNTPPKGTKEAWEKITSLYVANATIMTDAAERKDKETANRHQQALSRMCATCHRAHR